MLDAPSSSTYPVSLTVGSYASTPSQATFSVHSVTAGIIATPATGGNPATQAKTAPIGIRLTQGLSVIGIVESSGEFALYGATVGRPSVTIVHGPR